VCKRGIDTTSVAGKMASAFGRFAALMRFGHNRVRALECNEIAMATLLTCQGVSKHFGSRELFHGLSISFADDEHVGFLGPNGSGKTTFLKILAGLIDADSGQINKRRTARIGFLPQEDRFAEGASVASVLDAAIADQRLEPHEHDTKIDIIRGKFGFDQPQQRVDELSGGWRKRLALAREFIQEPDLLLMDEPTNHLDLDGIQWLEEALHDAPFAFLAVSHDRYFLERVTDRVVELNPAYPEGYFSVSGSYSVFLEKRAEFLEARQAQEATLSGIVRREAAFLKSNSKAQRTKSKWRTEEAYRLTDELRDLQHRNAQTATAGIGFESTGRKSKKLLEAKGVSKTLGGKLLFKDVSLFLSPGTRLGLLGSNGSGKTTLIRILTGVLPPDAGTVETAEHLRIVVFDQLREELPQEMTLRQALAGNRDSVEFCGRNIHVSSWATRFLFRIDQLDMPVGELSGGEQSRILIARLMLRPADLLILDEPTNDLDIASLDALEESLIEFPGAVVLVTHDRFMLDRVCTEILGLHGDGRIGRYGNCAQWQETQAQAIRDRDKSATKPKPNKPSTKTDHNGLTSREKKELQGMEAAIRAADERCEQCCRAAQDPAVAGDHVEAQKRWEEHEAATKHSQALLGLNDLPRLSVDVDVHELFARQAVHAHHELVLIHLAVGQHGLPFARLLRRLDARSQRRLAVVHRLDHLLGRGRGHLVLFDGQCGSRGQNADQRQTTSDPFRPIHVEASEGYWDSANTYRRVSCNQWSGHAPAPRCAGSASWFDFEHAHLGFLQGLVRDGNVKQAGLGHEQ
jgi:ATP-binding cassette subfamily F protein uup